MGQCQALDNGCLVYEGRKTKKGYGKFRVRVLGRRLDLYAHREVWAYLRRRLPKGQVRHLCHNHACVAIAHLAEGDSTSNAQDELNTKGSHKLSEAQVRELREFAATGATYAEVAEAFGMTQVSARAIATGRSFPRVGGPVSGPRSVSRADQDAALALMAQGVAPSEIAEKFHTTRGAVYGWRSRATRVPPI